MVREIKRNIENELSTFTLSFGINKEKEGIFESKLLI
jgi:hypothetical protein